MTTATKTVKPPKPGTPAFRAMLAEREAALLATVAAPVTSLYVQDAHQHAQDDCEAVVTGEAVSAYPNARHDDCSASLVQHTGDDSDTHGGIRARDAEGNVVAWRFSHSSPYDCRCGRDPVTLVSRGRHDYSPVARTWVCRMCHPDAKWWETAQRYGPRTTVAMEA